MKYFAIINSDNSLKEIKSFELGENPFNSTELLPMDIIVPVWDGTNWVESLTENEVYSFRSELKKEIEFEMYLKRKLDGENAYLRLSAEFRILKQLGTITEQTHNYLEELLTPVRNEVMFGQWKKGLSILEAIGSNQIGVDLFDRLHLQILTYINESY
jgi:hypothetical protein